MFCPTITPMIKPAFFNPSSSHYNLAIERQRECDRIKKLFPAYNPTIERYRESERSINLLPTYKPNFLDL